MLVVVEERTEKPMENTAKTWAQRGRPTLTWLGPAPGPKYVRRVPRPETCMSRRHTFFRRTSINELLSRL